MANVLVEETSLTNIANAIRTKNGTTTTYKPSEMATAISAIETGGGGSSAVTKGLIINEYDDSGYPIDVSLVGMTEIPTSMFSETFSGYGSGGRSLLGKCTNFNFPDGLTKIGDFAFYHCVYLPFTELPSSLTSIGGSAFYNCTNIAFTELPDGITSIGNNAFYQCTKLALTKLPDGVTSLGSSVFYNCTALALAELPSGVTLIGSNAFKGCTNLALTKLPDGVTSLGSSCFEGCTNLPLTELPSGVTAIAGYSFRNCTKITNLTLNGDIWSIANYVFNVTSVPTLSNKNSFTNTPIASGTGYIYVPDDLVDSFKSASNWSTYAAQIKGVSEL